jgi:hypothetical protein
VWLYSRGSSMRESDLGYHDLLTDFLEGLCDRTGQAIYCGTATNFVAYKAQPPVVAVEPNRLRGGKPGRVLEVPRGGGRRAWQRDRDVELHAIYRP